MRRYFYYFKSAAIVCLIGSVIAVGSPMVYARADQAPIKAFVSIPPQAYFVERISGEDVEVQVMVGPGQSPATYEPDPRQMTLLSHSDVYFTIDMPFERQLVKKMARFSERLYIPDTRAGVRLREMGKSEEHSDHDHGLMDPHMWLDPMNVKILS
ncbi:MAG: zinc ABC transporter substrate-binding protein, partial [Candidatus Zixiibacteriota bacterium]